ncbi:rRNA maturation RNase YbeY [Effusibacillus lacus]|uniref:Endoribonuclease YbeY n=1 Tax=Effusibacillus lacus TaxID=1348429 RepID=A0A292YSV7_9BACL|nr:rRNA maturation RNase YbeY [Effusibacillus lacus]TCS70360.1 putative rRNA maturation factor [Effusibacillus lacus]GAX91514.1 16S rRNA maturation RNase YbeY [Effusibacillus lacus]
MTAQNTRVIVEIVDDYGAEFAFDVVELLTKAIRAAAAFEQIEAGEVVVSLVDDETIRELNRTYRKKDAPTDVLSFALQESDEEEPDILYSEDEAVDSEPLGDIVISIPTALRQAEEYSHSLERELAFLAVHGFLHLIGYDHGTEEEEKEMFSRQESILVNIGLTRG